VARPAPGDVRLGKLSDYLDEASREAIRQRTLSWQTPFEVRKIQPSSGDLPGQEYRFVKFSARQDDFEFHGQILSSAYGYLGQGWQEYPFRRFIVRSGEPQELDNRYSELRHFLTIQANPQGESDHALTIDIDLLKDPLEQVAGIALALHFDADDISISERVEAALDLIDSAFATVRGDGTEMRWEDAKEFLDP